MIRFSKGKVRSQNKGEIPHKPQKEVTMRELSGITFRSTKGYEYSLNKCIGIGGMAHIYSATRHTTKEQYIIEERCVVKMLFPEFYFGGQSKNNIKRVMREIEAMAKIRHPLIPNILDSGILQDSSIDTLPVPFIVASEIMGKDLYEWILQGNQGSVGLPVALELALFLCSTLDHVHERKIIHRDVKPENIIINMGDQLPYLIDFGICFPEGQQSEEERLTRYSAMPVTEKILSPEAICTYRKGEQFVPNRRTDLFGLGITLFFMLTGMDPYGDGENRSKKIDGEWTKYSTDLKNGQGFHLAVVDPFLRQMERDDVASLEENINWILEGLLAPNPDDRFQTCKQVATGILEVMADFQIGLSKKERLAGLLPKHRTLIGTVPYREDNATRLDIQRAYAPKAVEYREEGSKKKTWKVLAAIMIIFLTIAGTVYGIYFHPQNGPTAQQQNTPKPPAQPEPAKTKSGLQLRKVLEKACNESSCSPYIAVLDKHPVFVVNDDELVLYRSDGTRICTRTKPFRHPVAVAGRSVFQAHIARNRVVLERFLLNTVAPALCQIRKQHTVVARGYITPPRTKVLRVFHSDGETWVFVKNHHNHAAYIFTNDGGIQQIIGRKPHSWGAAGSTLCHTERILGTLNADLRCVSLEPPGIFPEDQIREIWSFGKFIAVRAKNFNNQIRIMIYRITNPSIE